MELKDNHCVNIVKLSGIQGTKGELLHFKTQYDKLSNDRGNSVPVAQINEISSPPNKRVFCS